eukprot:scaffold76209_cov58-Phaeocystis_antarctica.AAC.1
MRAACAATPPTPSRLPSRRAPRPASYALLLTCRAHPPCPTPTSCSSVAHGRATRPLPQLAMARAGLWEAARPRRR